MQELGGEAAFATEVTPRPVTSYLESKGEVVAERKLTIGARLRLMKDKARQAEQLFNKEKARHHQLQRSFDRTARNSLLRRVDFMKAYANKKAKLQHREMLEGRRAEGERVLRVSAETVKRRKLEEELHHILLQNEEEEHIQQLQSQHRQRKQVTKRRLEEARQEAARAQRHDQVRQHNHEFMIRKRYIQSSISQRAQRNYQDKVNHEMTVIRQYEGIMGDIEKIGGLEELKMSADMGQTLDTDQRMYMTAHNTISL